MAIGPASKGSSNVAQAFLDNKATQPSGQVPTITQPQQGALPQLDMPQQQQQGRPQQSPEMNNGTGGGDMFGSMFPGMRMYDNQGNQIAGEPSPYERVYVPGQDITGESATPGHYTYVRREPAVQQQAPQRPRVSQSQQMARAINRRAQNRG